MEPLKNNVFSVSRKDRIEKERSFNNTHRENCVLLNSVQEFIEGEAWLLLTFLLCSYIVTRKEIVWQRRNFFCLCYVPVLTSAQSFRKGTKSSGSFNNRSLNESFGRSII